jgi:hypothetical protein
VNYSTFGKRSLICRDFKLLKLHTPISLTKRAIPAKTQEDEDITKCGKINPV